MSSRYISKSLNTLPTSWIYLRCQAIEEARTSLVQCGQCSLLLPASLSGSGRDREEACPEDLRVLVELEAAIELPELQSRFAPDTQVAIAETESDC